MKYSDKHKAFILTKIIFKSGNFAAAQKNLNKVKFGGKSLSQKTIRKAILYYKKKYNYIEEKNKRSRIKLNFV